MSDSPKTRWQFGSGNMEALLKDVAEHKGESLWEDAWRRLKRNRSAFWSMVFLVLFGMTSVIAPILPIASPVALSLDTGITAPSWPWESPPAKTDETPKGTAITSNIGSLFDNGWRHRTVAHFSVERKNGSGVPSPTSAKLAELVAQETGRTVALDARSSVISGGPSSLHIGIPFKFDDSPRIDWEPGGETGKVIFSHAGNSAGWMQFDVPVDETSFVAWRVETATRDCHLVLEGPGGELTRFAFKLHGAFKGRLLGITLNGRRLATSGRVDNLNAPDGIAAAPKEAPAISIVASFGKHDEELFNVAAAAKQARIVLDEDGSEKVLFERIIILAGQEHGQVHDDLQKRLQRGLAGLAFDKDVVVSLTEVASENGYWELGGIDNGLLAARIKMFGLWQTGNWMGTDSKGRDILSRIIWGSRTSIMVALVATLCSLLIGVTYGAFSGFMGGRIDNLMMRFVDILYSLPFIFVVIFLITIMNEYRTELQDNFGIDRELAFYVVIGAIYWLTMARVVRGQVLSLKNSEFIDAARVIGASTPRILFMHLVPNVLSIVIIYLTLTIPAVMLFESFLSFLGLGIEPPKVSWGTLAVDGTEAVNPVRIYWWLVVFPALAMGSFLLALNVLGDGLRDALDPKLRGKD